MPRKSTKENKGKAHECAFCGRPEKDAGGLKALRSPYAVIASNYAA
jgi:hypothetical protein